VSIKKRMIKRLRNLGSTPDPVVVHCRVLWKDT